LDSSRVIAIVDDDQAVRIGLGNLMRSADVANELFPTADAFLESDLDRFALVLSDIQMPGMSGLDLLSRLRELRPKLPVVLMTAFPDERVRARAETEGAVRLFVKPCDPDELIAVIETLLAAGERE
jgi:FixJ family two-component response regulator